MQNTVLSLKQFFNNHLVTKPVSCPRDSLLSRSSAINKLKRNNPSKYPTLRKTKFIEENVTYDSTSSSWLVFPSLQQAPYLVSGLLPILPRATLLNLIKAFAIKSIESLSSTPPHISRSVLIHTLNTTIQTVGSSKHGKRFWIW